LRLFGPSTEERWRELADAIGGEYSKTSRWNGDRVVTRFNCWSITLDLKTESAGESSQTYTRLRAAFLSRDGFRFTIRRRSVMSFLTTPLGAPEVATGYPDFDSDFTVHSERREQAAALLANDRLRALLMAQKSFGMRVIDNEGRFARRFADNEDELYFRTGAVVRDVVRLKGLFEVFEETLSQLCSIGSAYDADPEQPFVVPVQDSLLRGADAPVDSNSLPRAAEFAPDGRDAELPRAASDPTEPMH
jgi:hypothetical protein